MQQDSQPNHTSTRKRFRLSGRSLTVIVVLFIIALAVMGGVAVFILGSDRVLVASLKNARDATELHLSVVMKSTSATSDSNETKLTLTSAPGVGSSFKADLSTSSDKQRMTASLDGALDQKGMFYFKLNDIAVPTILANEQQTAAQVSNDYVMKTIGNRWLVTPVKTIKETPVAGILGADSCKIIAMSQIQSESKTLNELADILLEKGMNHKKVSTIDSANADASYLLTIDPRAAADAVKKYQETSFYKILTGCNKAEYASLAGSSTSDVIKIRIDIDSKMSRIAKLIITTAANGSQSIIEITPDYTVNSAPTFPSDAIDAAAALSSYDSTPPQIKSGEVDATTYKTSE